MKKFINVFEGEIVNPPPIWLMRQAGRHLKEYKNLRKKAENFLSFCYSPSLAAEATLQPIHRYGLDAAILFSDILVIPDALGQHVSFVESIGPKLEPIKTIKEIQNLQSDNLYHHLKPIYQTISFLTKKLPKETALIGFSGAPWTLASYMIEGGTSRDFSKTRRWAYRAPEEFQLLIDCLIDAISSHLIYQVDSGSEALQIFDTWAGLLPTNQFEKWVIQPIKSIIDNVKQKYPEIPIIGFPKGAGLNYEKFVIETAVDAVSVDSTMPLKWVKEKIQPKCVVQGNLDNICLLEGGPDLEKNIDEIMNNLSGGRFIFNLGHGVLPETPVSHIEYLIERVRKSRG